MSAAAFIAARAAANAAAGRRNRDSSYARVAHRSQYPRIVRDEALVLFRSRSRQRNEENDDEDEESRLGIGDFEEQLEIGSYPRELWHQRLQQQQLLQQRQNSYLRRILYAVLFFIRTRIKAATLLSIIFYFVYLENRASHTNNWESTRLIGYAAMGSCTKAGMMDYGVASFPAITVSGIVYAESFAYETSSTHNQPNICFSSNQLEACAPILTLPQYNLDPNELTSLFMRQPRSYFPLSYWILMFSLVASLITILYDKTHFVPDEQGSFVLRSEHALSYRVNILLCVCLCAFLIASSQSFVLMFQESCENLYVGAGTGTGTDTSTNIGDSTPSFCAVLHSCQATINSVISPEDVSITLFPEISSVMAAVLAISLFLSHASFTDSQSRVQPQDFDNVLQSINNRLSNMPQAHGELRVEYRGGEVVLIRRRNPNGRDPSTNGGMQVSGSFVDQMHQIANRTKMAQSWKIKTGETKSDFEKDCAICLNPLYEFGHTASFRERIKPTNSPRVDNATTGEEGQGQSDSLSEDQTGVAGVVTAPVVEGGGGEGSSGGHVGGDMQTGASSVAEVDNVVVELRCRHEFHRTCILTWSISKNSCPICRTSFYE